MKTSKARKDCYWIGAFTAFHLGRAQQKKTTVFDLITPLSDGSLQLPLRGGYSGNGVSAQAVTDAELERQRIHGLQQLIHDRAAEVARALKTEGYTGNTEVIGRLNFGNGVQWVSFDGFRVCFAV